MSGAGRDDFDGSGTGGTAGTDTAHTAGTADTAQAARIAAEAARIAESGRTTEAARTGHRPGTGGGLWVARIDPAEHFRTELLALQERGSAVLDLLGANPLDRDEVTELPGAPQLALLHALKALHERSEAAPAAGDDSDDSGGAGSTVPAWDTVVIDLPPLPDTLAALALPRQLRRYLRRLLPPERQAARALRPMLAQLAGVPMPARWLYETAERCERDLAAAQALLDSGTTTVRLVLEPGPTAAETLRTARAALALYGLPLDAVVANRLLPTGSTDPWLAAASGHQQTALKGLYEDLAEGSADPAVGPPVHELPHLGHEPSGPDDLAVLAEAGGLAEPTDADRPVRGSDASERGAPPGHSGGPGHAGGLGHGSDQRSGPGVVEDRLADEGVLVWRLPLPGAEREELDLVRRGDELVLAVGPFRRIRPLPSALRRCSVSGARLADGELSIRFTPDPALWPSGQLPTP
ncbi:ArsA family ATPase [Streptomyces pathocidini]|uniref:ArsA family ATPase n=1 Tax=Streptomyces pathocidini TaxID=1650571 RepID=UPI00099EE255